LLNCIAFIPIYGIMVLMIRSIQDKTTQDIFDGADSKAARSFPKDLHLLARRKLDQLNAAKVLDDLKVPPGNRLHALKNEWKGFHSISINDQWRIVFRWTPGNADDVKIIDYH
jgi:proteic killer suppression protein